MQMYDGKLVRIDLETSQIDLEKINPEIVYTHLLGSGLAARLFYDALTAGQIPADPLDPANPLYAFAGLLTGSIAPTGCRSSWCARSPLTGLWGEANMGGHWGAELVLAGYAGLILEKGSDTPVYLWIDGEKGTIALRDARHLWGLDQFETHEQIRAETDARAQIASIGPAGENLVRFAAVMQGGPTHSRAAGRTGMGALMGAKKLKAIAVRGTQRPTYPDPTAMRTLVKKLNKIIRKKAAGLHRLGTSGGLLGAERFGDLPLQNWQGGSWPDGAESITGQTMHDTIWSKDNFCYACPIGCGKVVEIKKGRYAGTKGEGPEYETLAGFGGNLLIDDLEAIVYMNDLCNRLGLDTISASGVLAFATEAFERGLLSPADTGGIELRWGQPEPIIKMLQKIARREGIGDLLAEGSRAAARKLGPEAAPLAIQVKGLELPYHDPRAFVDMALNYATANRGACHLESLTYWRGYGLTLPGWQEEARDRFEGGEKAAQMVIEFQDYLSTFNPLGLCKFILKGGMTPAHIAPLINAALGWEWTTGDLLTTGRRIFDLKRQINLRLGLTPADDTLPARLLTQPRPSGTAQGILPDLPSMLAAYYRLRGWEEKDNADH